MSRLLPLVCLAAPAGVAAQDTTHKEPKPKRSSDLISLQEIPTAPDGWQTGFPLVEQLRPNWPRQHGMSSMHLATPLPQVYVGGIKRGGPSTLEDVPRTPIKEIQHLRGTDASQRYGMGHESGAILVLLK